MAEATAAIYLLTVVLVLHSLYGSVRQRHELIGRVSEPNLKRHLLWHSLSLLGVAAFYELPIAAFLLAIPAAEYALLRSFCFAFFVVAAFLSIKPLFDLGRAYSFTGRKPLVTELILFFFLLTAVMLSLSIPSVSPAQAYPITVAIALSTAAGAVMYYYAGTRLGDVFNEPSLKAYLPSHALLMLAVLLLSQVEVLLWVGVVPPSFVQLLGVIGLLAFVAIVEIDKAVSWKHIARFARDYAFHGDGNANAPAPGAEAKQGTRSAPQSELASASKPGTTPVPQAGALFSPKQIKQPRGRPR